MPTHKVRGHLFGQVRVLAGSLESTDLAIQAIQTLQRMHDVFSDMVEDGRVSWKNEAERRKALRIFDRSNALCYLTLSISPPNRRNRPAGDFPDGGVGRSQVPKFTRANRAHVEASNVARKPGGRECSKS